MAAPVITFRNGEVCASADYTPSGSDVTAGDVIAIGNILAVAPKDIPDGELGAVSVFGGVYEGPTDGAIGAGVQVWFDIAEGNFTLDATGNLVFGFSVNSVGSATTGLRVFHAPVSALVDAPGS